MNWLAWYMIVFVYFPLALYVFIAINAIALTKEIYREYDVEKSKMTVFEAITILLNLLVRCFIPLHNLMLLSFALSHDAWKTVTITSMYQKGRIKEEQIKDKFLRYHIFGEAPHFTLEKITFDEKEKDTN